MDDQVTTWLMYGFGGGSWLCVRLVILMWGLWGAFRYHRDPTPEKASTLSWVAFGLSTASVVLCGCWLAWIPLVLVGIERGRAYDDKVPLKSIKVLDPAQGMAVAVLVLDVITWLGVAAFQLSASGTAES